LNIDQDKMNEINAESSCRRRVERIYELGGKLIYSKTSNNIFNSNLMLVDSNFSKILAQSVVIFYRSEKRKLKDIITELNNIETSELDMENRRHFLTNNFKKFLFYSAVGMVAKTVWNGVATSQGGIIVVKNNGDIVGYPSNNINLFQEYLLNKTKFDSPDSKRNRYGKIEKNGDDYFMKLNFQIRFIE